MQHALQFLIFRKGVTGSLLVLTVKDIKTFTFLYYVWLL